MKATGRWRRAVLGAVLLVAIVVPALRWWRDAPTQAPSREVFSDPPPSVESCSGDLHGFLRCVRDSMPQRGSGAAEPLSPLAMQALQQTAATFLAGSFSGCQLELPLPALGRYATRQLRAGDRRYCALWEVQHGAGQQRLGWGTLIVNRSPSRALVLGAPHPLFDTGTAEQALELFVAVDARALVLAGSHRYASDPEPGCRAAPTDASHSRSGYLAMAAGVAEVLNAGGQPWWYLEWHGMRGPQPGESCFDVERNRPLDVYLTEGSAKPLSVDGFAMHLADALRRRQPDLHVATPDGESVCNKSGTTNLLGRHLNDRLPDLERADGCRQGARVDGGVSGTFVHIEQLRCPGGGDCGVDVSIRRADRWREAVIDAYEAASESGG